MSEDDQSTLFPDTEESCPRCNGRGFVLGDVCDECEGDGKARE